MRCLFLLVRLLMPLICAVVTICPAVAQEDQTTQLEIMMEQLREMDIDSEKIFDEFFKDDHFSDSENVFDDFDRAQQQLLNKIPKTTPQRPPVSQIPTQRVPDKFQAVGGDPTVTQEDSAEQVMVHIKVPGMDQNSVNIKVDENTIRVMGAAQRQQEQVNAQGAVQQTSFTSRFQRVFPIPTGVDSKGMDVKKSKDEIVLIFPKQP